MILLITYKSIAESAWAEDMGGFLYLLDPDTRKITRRLKKKKQIKMIISVPSSLTNLCDVACYREREGKVNSLTLLYLKQQALGLTAKTVGE